MHPTISSTRTRAGDHAGPIFWERRCYLGLAHRHTRALLALGILGLDLPYPWEPSARGHEVSFASLHVSSLLLSGTWCRRSQLEMKTAGFILVLLHILTAGVAAQPSLAEAVAELPSCAVSLSPGMRRPRSR